MLGRDGILYNGNEFYPEDVEFFSLYAQVWAPYIQYGYQEGAADRDAVP